MVFLILKIRNWLIFRKSIFSFTKRVLEGTKKTESNDTLLDLGM